MARNCPQHPLGEPGAGQADGSVFVDNRAISFNKPPCYFVVEVFALVGGSAVQLGHLLSDLTIAVAALLLPGQAALGAGKSGLGFGGFDHLPFRGDEEVGVRPQVNPNSLLGLRQGYSLDLASEHHVPMLSLPLHRRGLDLPFERAVQLEFDRAHPVDEHPLPAFYLDPGSPGLGEGEGVVTPLPLKAGVACFLSRSDPTKKAPEGFVYPLDDVLQDLGVDALVLRQLSAYFGQPAFLLVEAQRLAHFPVSISPLLQSRIVQLAAQRKGALQVFALGLGGVKGT